MTIFQVKLSSPNKKLSGTDCSSNKLHSPLVWHYLLLSGSFHSPTLRWLASILWHCCLDGRADKVHHFRSARLTLNWAAINDWQLFTINIPGSLNFPRGESTFWCQACVIFRSANYRFSSFEFDLPGLHWKTLSSFFDIKS